MPFEQLDEKCSMEVLQSLLHFELTALDAYDRAVSGTAGEDSAEALFRIRQDHAEAAAVLRVRIRHFGGTPDFPTGIWHFEPSTAPRTDTVAQLLEEEGAGIGRYEDALLHPDVDIDCKDLIRYRLLPRCRANVRDLTRLRTAKRARTIRE